MYHIEEDQFQELALKLSEYQTDEIKKDRHLCKEVSNFYPARVVYYVSQSQSNPKNFHFERSEVLLNHALEIRVTFYTHPKKYFGIYAPLDFIQPVSRSDKSAAERQLTEPQKIGVLTRKKIDQWVKYFEDLRELLIKKQAENLEMQNDFKTSLLPHAVRWSNDNETAGYIEKNGIGFKFRIEESNIQTTIYLCNSINSDLSTFLKLSNNKLNR